MIKWSEPLIARAIALQTFARKCVVLVDNCSWTGHECDVLAVTKDLRIIDVEIKISRADLKADAKKDKWWQRRDNWAFTRAEGQFAKAGPPAPDVLQEWPRKVWKHYYALPAEIWHPSLIECLASEASGVLLLREGRGYTRLGHPQIEVQCVRRATPNMEADRIKLEQVIDIARLANLRMWEAYCGLEAMMREEREGATA